MQSNPEARRRKKRTFLEKARREQLVDVTIDTIAAQGYSQTSLSEIAKEADVSKSVILYHFDGKSELIETTINTILARSNAYIKERVEAQTSAADKLRAYLEASFDYIQSNRDDFVALVDLWGSFGAPEEKRRLNAMMHNPSRRHLAKILRQGQNNGEFRAFSTSAVASSIRAAIDGIILQWVLDAEAVNLAECRKEILEMLDRHTRIAQTR